MRRRSLTYSDRSPIGNFSPLEFDKAWPVVTESTIATEAHCHWLAKRLAGVSAHPRIRVVARKVRPTFVQITLPDVWASAFVAVPILVRPDNFARAHDSFPANFVIQVHCSVYFARDAGYERLRWGQRMALRAAPATSCISDLSRAALPCQQRRGRHTSRLSS